MATRSRKTRPDKARPVRAAAKAKSTVADALRDDVLNLKRDRILQEAANLFHERGYLQTSVDAIAERLGATKPFVYYHFDSKVDMLMEICERGTGDALVAIDEALRTPGAPMVRFEAFMRAFTRMAVKNHEFVAIYFREEYNLPPQSVERIRQMRKSISRKLQTLLAEGVASGDFDIDDLGISALVLAGMASYAFAWYREHGRLNLDQVTDEIVRMALKMVRRASPCSTGTRQSVAPLDTHE